MWVVWTLRALFESPLSADLTFKGGTSLSKAYKIIDRFSEDIDLTYDIRKLIPDLIGDGGDLPASRSQAGKWTKAVRHRLPEWIKANVRPVIEASLARDRLEAKSKSAATTTTSCFCNTRHSHAAPAMSHLSSPWNSAAGQPVSHTKYSKWLATWTGICPRYRSRLPHRWL